MQGTMQWKNVPRAFAPVGIVQALVVATLAVGLSLAGAATASAQVQLPTSVQLTADKTSVRPGEAFVLTATTDRNVSNTGYFIEIFDLNKGVRVTSCTTGTTCTATQSVPWSENPSPIDRRYEARVRSSTTIALSSAELLIDVRTHDFAPTLTPEKQSVTVGDYINLTATTDLNVSGTGYFIEILRDGVRLRSCTTGTSCTASEFVGWTENVAPQPHQYVVKVRTSTHTAGTSEATVDVYQYRFVISLAVTNTPDIAGNHYSATATLVRSLAGTPYALKIRNELGTQITSCTSGLSCTANVSEGTRYIARVEDTQGRVYGSSYWWQVDGDGAQELRAGQLDIMELAKLYPDPAAFCEAVLVAPGGTYVDGSSVKDEWFRCKAAQEAGQVTPAVVVATLAAGVAAVGVVAWATSHAPPDPGDPPTDPPGGGGAGTAPWRPVQPPDEVFRTADMASVIIQKNPAIDLKGQVETVVRQCQMRMSSVPVDPAECTRLPIFLSGTDVAEASQHDLEAIAGIPDGPAGKPQWAMLRYEKGTTKEADPQLNRRWYTTAQYKPLCEDLKQPGQSCDEYPFWASQEGGRPSIELPSLKPINTTQNTDQGVKYGTFVGGCRLKTAVASGLTIFEPGDPFIVLPIPPSLLPEGVQLPTQTKLCNDFGTA